MANQRRFEASTLAAVLAKVQKEIGPAARIASAQRVRTGGVFGFFQRERFEVIVDIPEPGEIMDAPAPTSLLELAEQVNADEGGTRSTAPAPSPPSAPKISTESDSFAEVLSRIAYQSHLTSDPAPQPEAIITPPPPPSLPAPNPELVDESKDEDRPAVIKDRPAFLDAPSTIPTSNPAAPVPIIRTRITDSPLTALGVPASYLPAPGASDESLQSQLMESLERLPQPPSIRPSKGSVIAVVGERSEAMDLAGELAQKWGRPKEEVVLASPRSKAKGAGSVLRSVQAAQDARRSWSRRGRPTIVAIDARLGSGSTTWAEHVLTALEPIATYGVADATRKSEDVAAWARQLGGVDCLAVNHLDDTVSPASILGAGIPVERIDGQPATPARWATLLTERLGIS